MPAAHPPPPSRRLGVASVKSRRGGRVRWTGASLTRSANPRKRARVHRLGGLVLWSRPPGKRNAPTPPTTLRARPGTAGGSKGGRLLPSMRSRQDNPCRAFN